MKLSIIIPSHNEEKNIPRTLAKLIETFTVYHYDYEVVVVCDGCQDKTAERARGVKSSKIRVLEYQPNLGKGYALKYGVRQARGDVIVFYDAGGDFHPSHIDRFVKLMDALRADIVIGSKRHPMSRVDYPRNRRLYSWIYQLLIRLLFNLKIRDTQVGLKVIRRKVLRAVLPRVVVKQYAFDLEMLVVANHLGFHQITEAPVDLRFNFRGTGIKSSSIFNMLRDTAAIFYRLRILRYYDKAR